MSSDLTANCRTCMKADNSSKYYQLYDYIEGGPILEMVDGIVPQIHIKEENQLSHSVCQLCVDKLLTCHRFQQLCIETDKELRRLMGLSLSPLEADSKPEHIWDPLMEEESLEMKIEIEVAERGECDMDMNAAGSVEVTALPSANELGELEVVKDGMDDSDGTDTSNETLNVLKERTLRVSLKAAGHSGDSSKVYPCTDCGKVFDRLSRLKVHGSVHAKKRAFTCNICNYSFTTEKTYRAHKRKHKEANGKSSLLCPDNAKEVMDHPAHQLVEEKKVAESSQTFELDNDDYEFDGNEEWLDSEDDFVVLKDEIPEKKRDCKPKHGKNVDFVDTGIGEIEKPNSSNRRNGNYPCEVCGKIFDRPFRLKRHSSVHSLDKPYACEICKCRFSTASYLKTHKLLHKNKSPDDMSSQDGFKCPDCPRRFEKQTSLSAHRQIHTRNSFIASYSCTLCQRTFMSVKTLTEHVTNKHPDAEKHKCDECDKSFVLHAHLVEHQNRHKGNKNLVCVICEKEFGFMSTLKEHMRVHSGESPYLCPECGKTFRNGSNLRQHMERHSDLKKYQCPECPSRFNCRSDLKKHIDTHQSIKSHECDICGSRFTRSYTLQKHKRLHLGKRPHKCDECNMTFSLLYHLRRHMRTHTGEKPYKCKYCERAYAESGDLNKHLRSHVGENTYMCDKCPKAFKYQLQLRQHYAEHFKIDQQTKEKPTEYLSQTATTAAQ